MTLQDIQANKSVTKADIKFIETYIKELDTQDFANPWSGETLSLSGYMAGLYQFIKDLSNCDTWDSWDDNVFKTELKNIHSSLTPKNWISKFDRARHLILKLDSSVYMTLID